MPIILAIEPDRRQAAHLAGVVRHKVEAELILANTTEGALDAIGNRVPDMVLVPALLSPQDDAALAAALRVIAAAANVRTLTIPVLANGTKRTKPGGMLAKWRRGRAESPAPDGCDPSVFAEQINAYLREAAAERAALAELDDADETGPVPIHAAQPIQMKTREAIELATPEPIAFALPSLRESLVVEPIEAWAAEPIEQLAAVALVEDESTRVWSDGRVKPEESDAVSAASVDGQTDIDLSEELDGLAEESLEEELFAGEPVGVYTISSVVEEPAMRAFDLLPGIREPATITERAAASVAEAFVAPALVGPALVEAPVVEALVVKAPVVEWRVVEDLVEEFLVEDTPADEAATPRSDVAPWVPMYLTPGRMWPPLEGMLAEAATSLDEFQAHPEDEPIAAFVQAEIAQPEARPEPRPAAASPKPDHPEWLELIASLRQDIQRRRGEPVSVSAPPIAARPADSGDDNGSRRVKKQKPFGKKSKPVQDEWGFFDPEQCGFSALLAKLEEITDPPAESDARQPS
jgi:hypothetical protein